MLAALGLGSFQKRGNPTRVPIIGAPKGTPNFGKAPFRVQGSKFEVYSAQARFSGVGVLGPSGVDSYLPGRFRGLYKEAK